MVKEILLDTLSVSVLGTAGLKPRLSITSTEDFAFFHEDHWLSALFTPRSDIKFVVVSAMTAVVPVGQGFSVTAKGVDPYTFRSSDIIRQADKDNPFKGDSVAFRMMPLGQPTLWTDLKVSFGKSEVDALELYKQRFGVFPDVEPPFVGPPEPVPPPVDLFEQGFTELTGEVGSEHWTERFAFKLSDLTDPINAVLKLVFGKNLRGEVEEFGSSDDWWNLMFTGFLLLPGPFDDWIARFSKKFITSGEAAKLASKASEVANSKLIVDILEEFPVKFGRGFVMTPPGVQTSILRGIGREVSERTVFTPMKLLVDHSSRVGVKAEVGLLYDEVLGKSLASAIKRGLTSGELSWLAARVETNPLRAAEIFIKSPKNWALLGADAQKVILDALARSTAVYATTIGGNLARQLGITVGGSTLAKAGILLTIPSPKTIFFGLTGILGLVSMAYGIPFGTSWFAKEGLKEVFEIPLADRMRDYRRNPNPELLAIIEDSILKVEAAIPIAKNLINSVSWMWPWTKNGWDFFVENLSFEVDNIKAELAIVTPPPPEPVPPPVEPPPEEPVVPPVDLPPETDPGEETPDPERTPETGKSFITIDSNPRGASIWIDGKSSFTVTPFAHLLDSGQHTIQLQLFRYQPTFEILTLEVGKSIIKTYTLKALEPVEPDEPFIPVPIEVVLRRPLVVVVKPNAWEYTITARDSDTGAILNAKIIIDGLFTGKYTTNSVILEPEAEYLLRLEAFGYEPGEIIIVTEELPD